MMTKTQDLPVILEKHRKWRRSEDGGERADLRGAYLGAADLGAADLGAADLGAADLSWADLRGACLRAADLRGADLRGAYLRGADLGGAYLGGADLSGADLSCADLRGACLRAADLRGAYLGGADLSGADLEGAYLAWADLEGARIADETTLSKAPIQISGLHYHVIIFDAHMQIGCEFHSLKEWYQFGDRRIAEMDGTTSARFWRQHKEAIFAIAAANGRWGEGNG